MDCIYCSQSTRVVNSRPQKRLQQVWRRRKCTHCTAVFTTLESVDVTTSLIVNDAQGKLAPFSRDKLFVSLLSSLGHRESCIDDAGSLTATICAQLRPFISQATISTEAIVKTVLQALERFDKAAAVHYKAYHQLS